jgi:ATP-dependent Lhr-like helicase
MPARVPAPLKPFHPLVREWFRETLGEPSAPQREGWPAIASGADTLILAPTGTGKTLSAFLWELNQLIVEGVKGPLANAVHILYVSPLKALNNDIQRNLDGPLAALKERFAAAGEPFPEIRVAVRTGDTTQSARARMIRKSPHVLITTPESLHIMLTTVRGRGVFVGVRAVIVDEIHAIAGTKRGAHLALTLERLDLLCERKPQRIGLSATQRPLEEIARFLSGHVIPSEARDLASLPRGTPRDSESRSLATLGTTKVVDCGLVKQFDLSIRSPVDDLGNIGGTIWPKITSLVLEKIRTSRTTLVFVNNRGQAEKMAARLNALAGEEMALPYHGSLSRERRLLLEQSLKAGKLRALVSTSSLELGIDIGTVDLVIQLQSPKRVASGLQRVGRAGHTLDAVSRGIFVPTIRDDALELLALVRAMGEGDVEPTQVVQNALDVLAQVVVAMVAVDEDWTSAKLFDVVRRSYPYHQLTRAAFDEVLSMLAGKYPTEVAAELEARLAWDRVTDALTPARGSRMVAVISGGTIPDRGLYTVNLPDRTRLGELDEEFVHETRLGDVFQLGSSTWRVQEIEHDRVIVTPAPGAPARMPFWHGEYMARSSYLTARIGELRRELDEVRTPEQTAALAERYSADEETAASLVEYVHEQRAITGTVPDDKLLVVEQFRDETQSLRVVLHAPFGGRVNAPWGMALAHRVRERLSGGGGGQFEIQVQTTDDGIMLRLPNLANVLPLSLLSEMHPDEAERRVLEEVGASSLFGARFRMNAARALLLPRGTPRRRMPLWLQRLKALDLLQAVRELPSFPILVETYRDVLQDAFDMPALKRVLTQVGTGGITLRTVETQQPSPMAASLQFGFRMDWLYADDAPRAEQRAALLSLDRALLDELMNARGVDDETMAVVDELLARRREKYAAAHGVDALEALIGAGTPRESTLSEYIALAGAFTVDVVVRRFGLDASRVQSRLDEWTRAGRLVRGPFGVGRETRWISRRLLEQARRRELARARKQIEAVELPVFARFLQRWQHVDPSTQLEGSDGTIDVARQLYGIARPAEQWERSYLPARVPDYDPDALTRLFSAGEAVWAGASPETAAEISNLASIRFFKRGTGRAWVAPPESVALGDSARAVRDALEQRGAQFFDELAAATSLSARQLRDVLRELAGAGLATNDTMESLRGVVRWRPLVSPRDRAQPDPTRWLPADFTPSPNRYLVQRRPNLRRLPKWRRPDKPDASPETWPGRWSLATSPGVMGPEADEGAWAEMVAQQWLARYGIVSREMWRREKPAVSWRAVYVELKRLEFRGDVRRGYFVRGLSGAQFALPEAVEMLRSAPAERSVVVLAASDPANAYVLPLRESGARDPFVRPRGRGSLLVSIAGLVVMIAERRGARVVVREGTAAEDVTRSASALVEYLVARSSRDLIVETIDGQPASGSRWGDAFAAAGFRRGTTGLRYYAAAR